MRSSKHDRCPFLISHPACRKLSVLHLRDRAAAIYRAYRWSIAELKRHRTCIAVNINTRIDDRGASVQLGVDLLFSVFKFLLFFCLSEVSECQIFDLLVLWDQVWANFLPLSVCAGFSSRARDRGAQQWCRTFRVENAETRKSPADASLWRSEGDGRVAANNTSVLYSLLRPFVRRRTSSFAEGIIQVCVWAGGKYERGRFCAKPVGGRCHRCSCQWLEYWRYRSWPSTASLPSIALGSLAWKRECAKTARGYRIPARFRFEERWNCAARSYSTFTYNLQQVWKRSPGLCSVSENLSVSFPRPYLSWRWSRLHTFQPGMWAACKSPWPVLCGVLHGRSALPPQADPRSPLQRRAEDAGQSAGYGCIEYAITHVGKAGLYCKCGICLVGVRSDPNFAEPHGFDGMWACPESWSSRGGTQAFQCCSSDWRITPAWCRARWSLCAPCPTNVDTVAQLTQGVQYVSVLASLIFENLSL